jgi:hypothetical protein
MSNIVPIDTKGLPLLPPFSSIYERWKTMKSKDYDSLLEYLYSGSKDGWKNPATKVTIARSSKIIISYLSIRYYHYHFYKSDDKATVLLGNRTLTYREHVLNFIDLKYLYNPMKKALKLAKNGSPKAPPAQPAFGPAMKSSSSKSDSPPGAAMKKKATVKPGAARGSPGAARGSPGAARGSPGAARGSPGAARGSPGAARGSKSSSASSNKLTFSPKYIATAISSMSKLSVNADKMSESKCMKFVKDIREAKREKTPQELKTLKVNIENPITKGTITSLRSPIIQSYLVKCYFSFDTNDKLKKAIKKVVDIDILKSVNDARLKIKKGADDKLLVAEKDKEAKRTAADKAKEAKRLAAEKEFEAKKLQIPVINTYIDSLLVDFNHHCDELVTACDTRMEKGKKIYILKDHSYIANVVNSIVAIIYTLYLHLPYLYDKTEINYDGKMSIKIILYDEELYEYYADKTIVDPVLRHEDVEDELIDIQESNFPIIYQHTILMQGLDNRLLDLIPKTVDNFYLNTLYNRQYVFNIYKDREDIMNFAVTYNRINVLDSRSPGPFFRLAFPESLNYAIKLFNANSQPFLYNLTNTTLPKYILISTIDPSIMNARPFEDITAKINARLKTLPTISGFANELTARKKEYDDMLVAIKNKSFGDNETGYGGEDMIRRNILYSINAQNPNYVKVNYHRHRKDLYFDSEFTGTFPLFTWIPLNRKKANDIYNFPSLSKWQPYGVIYNDTFVDVGNAYKNYGVSPWSKLLNDTVYKVISGDFESVAGLVTPYEVTRMTRRVNDTFVYKDMVVEPGYKNGKVYLYHGAKKRLHTMKDIEKDIEVLGFLSTSINIYTASYYSGVGIYNGVTPNKGFIYIIEVDDRQGYINLNDILYQIVLLPYTVIRIICEFKIGDLTIILCRLIKTPSNRKSNYLHKKMLGIPQPAGAAAKSDSPDVLVGGIGTLEQIMDTKKGKLTDKKKTVARLAAAPSLASLASLASLQSPQLIKRSSKNIIYPKADIRKVGDMPEDIRKYYGLTKERDDKMVDINNGCHFRIL